MNMYKYFKKYSIILIVLIGLKGLITFFVISQLSMILIKLDMDLNKANYLTSTIATYIDYPINLIIALIMFCDLLKNKIKGLPIILLSVFSYFAGIILFFLLMNNKIKTNGK